MKTREITRIEYIPEIGDDVMFFDSLYKVSHINPAPADTLNISIAGSRDPYCTLRISALEWNSMGEGFWWLKREERPWQR